MRDTQGGNLLLAMCLNRAGHSLCSFSPGQCEGEGGGFNCVCAQAISSHGGEGCRDTGAEVKHLF